MRIVGITVCLLSLNLAVFAGGGVESKKERSKPHCGRHSDGSSNCPEPILGKVQCLTQLHFKLYDVDEKEFAVLDEFKCKGDLNCIKKARQTNKDKSQTLFSGLSVSSLVDQKELQSKRRISRNIQLNERNNKQDSLILTLTQGERLNLAVTNLLNGSKKQTEIARGLDSKVVFKMSTAQPASDLGSYGRFEHLKVRVQEIAVSCKNI